MCALYGTIKLPIVIISGDEWQSEPTFALLYKTVHWLTVKYAVLYKQAGLVEGMHRAVQGKGGAYV
jgi:hypothetical protein